MARLHRTRDSRSPRSSRQSRPCPDPDDRREPSSQTEAKASPQRSLAHPARLPATPRTPDRSDAAPVYASCADQASLRSSVLALEHSLPAFAGRRAWPGVWQLRYAAPAGYEPVPDGKRQTIVRSPLTHSRTSPKYSQGILGLEDRTSAAWGSLGSEIMYSVPFALHGSERLWWLQFENQSRWSKCAKNCRNREKSSPQWEYFTLNYQIFSYSFR